MWRSLSEGSIIDKHGIDFIEAQNLWKDKDALVKEIEGIEL